MSRWNFTRRIANGLSYVENVSFLIFTGNAVIDHFLKKSSFFKFENVNNYPFFSAFLIMFAVPLLCQSQIDLESFATVKAARE